MCSQYYVCFSRRGNNISKLVKVKDFLLSRLCVSHKHSFCIYLYLLFVSVCDLFPRRMSAKWSILNPSDVK